MENCTADQISPAHRVICGAAALVFAEYLQYLHKSGVSLTVSSPDNVVILLGSDTRPTGRAIVEAIVPVLLAVGCEVRYAGYASAPEIMIWAKSTGAAAIGKTVGFIYISASHNPIGHNGLKFGLADGGVLAAEEAVRLIANFRSFMDKDGSIERIDSLISAAYPKREYVYLCMEAAKAEAYKAYYDFCGDVAWGGSSAVAGALKDGLSRQPLGVVCDFNGSARSVTIDREFFLSLGLKFECINDKPGEITHRIVPEGEALEPCCELLEKAHHRDGAFMLGYVPDCDGDRGNLVIWDDFAKKTRPLEAQEVFALACIAELAHLVWTGELTYDNSGKAVVRAAIAVNDPTSMRIDRIADAFGVSVFRAEVGEANVVGLARRLREEGYIVRILGEGSAGGNITHPSAVRDPINTVLAIVKLLSIRSGDSNRTQAKEGFFEIWCRLSGQLEKHCDNFTLADIIASLPKFVTTSAYSQDAIMSINIKDHILLKDRYQEVFIRKWKEQKDELKTRFRIEKWEAIAYNGMEERRGLARFGEAGKGGLKISFLDSEGVVCAYIWMRGSATEPVLRIMADLCFEGMPLQEAKAMEQFLLDWQRRMIIESEERRK